MPVMPVGGGGDGPEYSSGSDGGQDPHNEDSESEDDGIADALAHAAATVAEFEECLALEEEVRLAAEKLQRLPFLDTIRYPDEPGRAKGDDRYVDDCKATLRGKQALNPVSVTVKGAFKNYKDM
jgi:hypothetical protein